MSSQPVVILPNRAEIQKRLLAAVARYAAVFPEETGQVDPFTEFLQLDLDWLDRRTEFGHLTASAWILGPCRKKAALIHHRKLGRWLQPGGHADGDADLLGVALREAGEETGLQPQLVFDPESGKLIQASRGTNLLPFDLDAHEIPASGGFPAHIHFDFRYLLAAQADELGPGDAGVTAVRWFSPEEVAGIEEQGIRRMAAKAAKYAGAYQLYSTV